jgi:glucokinase
VFIGGGIAPKLIDALPTSKFLARFDAKGRMQPLVEQMPVQLVTMNGTAIHGAAHYAARAARHGEPGHD